VETEPSEKTNRVVWDWTSLHDNIECTDMSSRKGHKPLPPEHSLDQLALANERTYAAWLRTGLSALAAGLAVEKFVVEVLPGWSVRLIAIVLIAVSAAAFGLAGWRFSHLGVRLEAAEVKSVPSTVTAIMSAVLVASSVVALICLWLVDPS